MTEWRVQVDQSSYESALFDVEVVDTANPYGNYAIARIDDTGGELFDTYSRGTRADFEYSTDGGSSWTNRFSGFAVEPREVEENGADVLEVECYSFDQFLRRSTVTNDQSGKTISAALEDIVTTDTPVAWVAGNVSVGDDLTLSRSFRGERVENVLQALRGKSTGEDFGVNSDIEFFWEQQETSRAPRNIDNTQWFGYDLPEEGKRAINEVTVFFNGGDESVTVDDGGDKLSLQDSIGTEKPVSFAEEITREDITDIGAARDEGEKLLADRATTLTGTVTTYGLLDAETGDVISIEIQPRGIDGDFRIAELEYRWGRDETILTIVEKRGNQDDVLVNLSDAVKRVEMREADRDATDNRITDTNVGVTVAVSGDVDGDAFDATRLTNTGRNKIRDEWVDGGSLDISTMAVGTDASNLSRTNTSLENEVEQVAASSSEPDATSVEFTASPSESSIREVGLLDGDGDLIARCVIDAGVWSSPTVTVGLDVADDPDVSRGVVTTAGQTAVRDILAGNSPATPTQFAYGSDGTAPTESDTALGNQVVAVNLDNLLVQSAGTGSGWGDLVDAPDDEPVTLRNGNLESLPICWFSEGRDYDDSTGSISSHTNSDYSGGEGAYMQDSDGDQIVFEFTPEYTIPAENVELAWRGWEGADDEPPTHEFFIDDESVGEFEINGYTLGWKTFDSFVEFGYGGGDLAADETHTFSVEIHDPSTSEGLVVDCIAVFDNRYLDPNNFVGNWDSVHESGGYLDGPHLGPDQFVAEFAEAPTRRLLQHAELTQSWTSVENNQFVELSNDGGANWTRAANSETLSVTFASAETGVRARVGLSNGGSRDTATPRFGFETQAITSHSLIADVDAITPADIGVADVRAIVSPDTIAGTTIREAAQLDGNGTALTRSIFADITVEDNARIISSERVTWVDG